MLRRFRIVQPLLLLVFAAVSFPSSVSASSDAVHEIAATKACISPVKVGDPYTCMVQMQNVVDTAQDTLRVSGLSDIVHSAAGDVATGNILPSMGLLFSGPVSCVGGSGAGTDADPYIGATECLLPFGSSVTTKLFSHYTVQPADYFLPGHDLTDVANVNWNNTCVFDPAPDCTTDPRTAAAGSFALVEQLQSSTATEIQNAGHQLVTTVETGSMVHDFVTVTGQPGNPAPSGTVSVDWFLNDACAGAPAATSGSVPLDANGQADAIGFAQGPLAPGFYGFDAHYAGDGAYAGSDSACEPLTVVDANIQITPNGVNRVGQEHVFTAHVNVNDGTGYANAPDGTQISFAIVSGPGVFTSANPCTISGGTGSCQIILSSAVTDVTTVKAITNVTVGQLTLHRETGDGHSGDSTDATKMWVNAAIIIAPNATNEVGQPHTFTVTLLTDTGSGLVPAGSGEMVTVTLTGSNGASPVPSGPFTLTTNAAGQVQVTFSSSTAGTVRGHALSVLSVSGSPPFTVETDGVAPNSGDAVKTLVDANIQIMPNGTNPVGATHTFTAHVNVNAGDGNGFVNAPDGTQISFTIDSGPGGFTSPNPCATSGGTGSCQITITSGFTGTTAVSAHTTASIGGAVVYRDTNGLDANSGPAEKLWADDAIDTKVRDAQNNDVTNQVVPAGTVVHDEATVTKAAGTPVSVPNPTGTVDFTLYDNSTCNGNVVATDPAKPLDASGTATSFGFTTPGTGGTFSFLAHYNGDADYPAHYGPCESFLVQAKPNSPPTATVSDGQCSATNAAGGSIDLTLFDADGDPLTLTFASNSNPAVVPDSKIILGGSGNSRTLSVTAAAKASGSTTITLNLSDGKVTEPVVITVMVGTDKSETLDGTNGIDMIFGLGGKNTINGNGGNDLLCGGNSNDRLNGGDGDDVIEGENGSDILDGGAGNDILRGNLGSDILTGGAGADSFSGGPGSDAATDFNAAEGDTQDGTIP